MSTTLIALIILFVVALLWLDGARARELATAISRAACKRQGFQLLDDSVYLQRIGIRWTDQGLRLRRMFRFEYSMEGTLRQTGHILLLGTVLEAIHISAKQAPESSQQEDNVPSMNDTPGGNVVPFNKRKR